MVEPRECSRSRTYFSAGRSPSRGGGLVGGRDCGASRQVGPVWPFRHRHCPLRALQ